MSFTSYYGQIQINYLQKQFFDSSNMRISGNIRVF